MNDIIFYDAACPLCSRVVRFILKQERDQQLFFSALQGEHARSFLPKKGIYDVDMKNYILEACIYLLLESFSLAETVLSMLLQR